MKPEGVAALAPAYKAMTETEYDYPTNASLQLLIYDTKRVTGADIARRCTDLLDPRFIHRAAVAYPALLKTLSVTVTEIARELPETTEQWRDTFGK